MFSVSFSTQAEATALYTYFHQQLSSGFFLRLNGTTLQIAYEDEQLLSADRVLLITAFRDFIIETYEETWLLELMSEFFYYTDKDDQSHILEITQSIMHGKRPELPYVDALPAREQLLEDALAGVIATETDFSFYSLKMFRLADYRNGLMRYTELAIDEYKLQQEYLSFIEKLRAIVQNYRPIHHTIYVEDNEPFVLYDDQLNVIHDEQNVRSLYPLLKQWGIEAEPSIVLSLISLAPKRIYVYTERQDDGVMRTLQSVFEERVVFNSLEKCPVLIK